MRKVFILIGIGVLFVALTMTFQLLRPSAPPAAPANNIVEVRPLPGHPAPATRPVSPAPAPVGSLDANPRAPVVIVTRVVLATVTPGVAGAPPSAGPRHVERLEVILATATPPAYTGATTLPTLDPRGPAAMATRGALRAQGLNPSGAALSPLETPVSPLATPTGPRPPGDVQAAAYALAQAIADAETTYYAQHQRFAQLLIGGDQAACPAGEPCISLAYPAGIQAGANVYIAPDGQGYEVIVAVGHWRLSVAAGPEAEQRTEGWHYAE